MEETEQEALDVAVQLSVVVQAFREVFGGNRRPGRAWLESQAGGAGSGTCPPGARPGDGEVRFSRAPGRVNLLGEHTDYEEGFVLPVAIDLDVVIGFRPRHDELVRLYSLDYEEGVEFSLSEIDYDTEHRWSNYLRGVAHVLQAHGIFERYGCRPRGMDAVVKGDVPEGAGLSSSAAFEVASALALLESSGIQAREVLTRSTVFAVELARLCQEAENDFVGVKCGIMDQMVSLLGRANSALFLDCRTNRPEFIPLPTNGVRLVVCDTGVRRGLLESEYNRRREECRAGVETIRQILGEKGSGIRTLRDVSAEEFETVRSLLPPVIARRCAHVIGENQRVLQSVEAFKRGRLREVGTLMRESHASLRDLYEVSCDALDLMVRIACEVDGVLGARMTGGGFGGCTINIVQEQAVARFLSHVQSAYRSAMAGKLSMEPGVYLVMPIDGPAALER